MMQWCKTSKFQMYDMGSAAKNQREYGDMEPPDVAASYHLLDFPIAESLCRSIISLVQSRTIH